MREYEVVYIFDSALDDSEIDSKLERFHGLVAGNGDGEVVELDRWGRRQLAYPIEDKENGFYVVAHINTTPEKLPEYERILQLDEGLLRYLIVVNEAGLPTSPAPTVEEPDEDEDGEEED